jgi:hypothetical protein
MADLVVTAASVLPSTSTIKQGTLGETCTAGQVVYLKSSDSRLWKAQADGTAAEADAVGILLSGGAAGQPASYSSDGPMIVGATTAAGVVYYVSATAGGIGIVGDLVSTNRVVVLGYGTGTGGQVTLRITNTGSVLA